MSLLPSPDCQKCPLNKIQSNGKIENMFSGNKQANGFLILKSGDALRKEHIMSVSFLEDSDSQIPKYLTHRFRVIIHHGTDKNDVWAVIHFDNKEEAINYRDELIAELNRR